MIFRIDSLSSYDHNTIVLNGGKFDNWQIDSVPPVEILMDAGYGRNSTPGLQLITNSYSLGSHGNVSAHLPGNYETIIIGAAVKVDTTASSTSAEVQFNSDKVIFSILDGATAQACLCITPSMRLRMRQDGVHGLELGRSDFYLHENVYYYIELKCLVSRTSGTFTVRVDGIQRLNGIGNTQFTDNQWGNGIRLGARNPPYVAAGRHIKFDDLYVSAVVVGSTYNDFIGDVMVEGRTAISEGPTHEWSPSAGTLHYALIDDSTPNLIDYVRAGTIDYTDVYHFSGVTVPSGSILAVMPHIYARKTTAGAANVIPVMSRQGTITAGDDINYLTQEYRYHSTNVWDRRPDDDSQWDLNFTDDTDFGVKRTG